MHLQLCFFAPFFLLPANPTDPLQTPGLTTSQLQADVTTTCLKELHCLIIIPLF